MTNVPPRHQNPSGRRAAAAPGTVGPRPDKQLSGLRITIIAAVVMLVAEVGLGLSIAQSVNVPDKDNGSGFFVAIGRALSNGPAAISVHATVGLLLIATALTTIVRAILTRRTAVLVLGGLGTLAILGANASGARFIGNGQDSESKTMLVAGIVALVCYLICLALTFTRQPGPR
jgi:hypothetical protein